jgi:hypothetical protein
MKNTKQTAVEWIEHQVEQQGITHYFSLREILEQAKEIEIAGKEMSYTEGYSEGYKRALDYMTLSIEKQIKARQNDK